MSKTKHIYTLLNQIGIRDQKEELVEGVTQGRTTSIRELTDQEANELIRHLRTYVDPHAGEKNYRPGNKIRRSIMSMAYTMMIINGQMSNDQKIEAIDRFLADHPKTGDIKPVNDMTIAELQALHYQFERFMMHKLDKA